MHFNGIQGAITCDNDDGDDGEKNANFILSRVS